MQPTTRKPATITAGPEVAGQLCSICQTRLIAGELAAICPDCHLPFHSECWEHNRGCSQYGCPGSPPTEKSATPDDPGLSSWAEAKTCPACDKTIKGSAIKCRFCGAVFETRQPMSARSYAGREYQGVDYVRARNQVIALFLLSASGCVAPLAAIVTAVLVFRGNVSGIDYRRFPPGLRALAIASLCVSCLLTLLLLGFAVLDA